jgi:hypothetical protein
MSEGYVGNLGISAYGKSALIPVIDRNRILSGRIPGNNEPDRVTQDMASA